MLFGITFCVGCPLSSSIALTSTVTGNVASLLSKYKSALVKKAPTVSKSLSFNSPENVSLLTVNDCAKGSLLGVGINLLSDIAVLSTCIGVTANSPLEILTSKPAPANSAVADEVTIPNSLLLLTESVITNGILSPEVNWFCSSLGKLNANVIAPLASVNNGEPRLEVLEYSAVSPLPTASLVTCWQKAETSTPSKYG